MSEQSTFTRRDVRIDDIIHDGDVDGIKGKITKKPRKMLNPDEVRDVPQHIVQNYSNVSLYIDVIHVNGIMFMVDVSKHIGIAQCIVEYKNWGRTVER